MRGHPHRPCLAIRVPGPCSTHVAGPLTGVQSPALGCRRESGRVCCSWPTACYVAADGGTSLVSIALSEITDAELGRDGYAPALGVRRRACNPSELRRQWMKSLRSQVVADPAAASLGELSSRCPICTCHTRACERCATYP